MLDLSFRMHDNDLSAHKVPPCPHGKAFTGTIQLAALAQLSVRHKLYILATGSLATHAVCKAGSALSGLVLPPLPQGRKDFGKQVDFESVRQSPDTHGAE
jgi:hypothetical protein